ncbi:MAG: glycosyltransferase family 4 protein [bacterium]|nr:glycosyltransferase family 4 protein [bacterium]
MKKHILVISPFFYPHTGGSQQYMEELYASLLTHHKDIEVTVLAYNTDGAPRKEAYRNMQIVRFPCLNILPGQFAIPNYMEVASYLLNHKKDFDLIHCNTRFFESSWWAPFYAKFIGKQIFLTDHSSSYPEHQVLLVKKISYILDRTCSFVALRLFDQVLTTNNTTKGFLKRDFGVNSDVLYGGINQDLFKPVKRKNRQVKVLFVGRMIDSKGPHHLYEAAKKLPKVSFTFTGPGPYVEILSQRLKKDKLKNVTILGGQNRQRVAKLMRESDILVHPSTHHEGLPNVLTEAGATGIAVIATNVGGTKEIIPPGCGIILETNQLEELDKHIQKLVGNKGLREIYGRALYKHVSRTFNWKRASDMLYKKILQAS